MKILNVLEPPPGGFARLVSRRDSPRRSPQPWWALAAGAATAAAVSMAVLTVPITEVRLQLSGARLVDERRGSIGVKILEGGRAVPLSSDAGDVQVYWVEPAEAPGSSRP